MSEDDDSDGSDGKGKVLTFPIPTAPARPGPATFGRPPQVAYRPERVAIASPSEPPKDWVIEDIKIGNVSQIPRSRILRALLRIGRLWGRLWRRLTWWLPRKPPKTQLIDDDKRR